MSDDPRMPIIRFLLQPDLQIGLEIARLLDEAPTPSRVRLGVSPEILRYLAPVAREILLPILVTPEDGRPLVPTHHDVVNASRKLQPRRPGHHKILQDFRIDPISTHTTLSLPVERR